jgi:hypothetical protein
MWVGKAARSELRRSKFHPICMSQRLFVGVLITAGLTANAFADDGEGELPSTFQLQSALTQHSSRSASRTRNGFSGNQGHASRSKGRFGKTTSMTSRIASKKPARASSAPAPAPSPEFDAAVCGKEIAQVAYRIWLERADRPGSPEEDWLMAETELRTKYTR